MSTIRERIAQTRAHIDALDQSIARLVARRNNAQLQLRALQHTECELTRVIVMLKKS